MQHIETPVLCALHPHHITIASLPMLPAANALEKLKVHPVLQHLALDGVVTFICFASHLRCNLLQLVLSQLSSNSYVDEMALASEPNQFSPALSGLATAFVPMPSMLGALPLIKLVFITSTPYENPHPILPSPLLFRQVPTRVSCFRLFIVHDAIRQHSLFFLVSFLTDSSPRIHTKKRKRALCYCQQRGARRPVNGDTCKVHAYQCLNC